jgi:hypothetical protein
MNLLGNYNVRNTKQYYWLASPSSFTTSVTNVRTIINGGGFSSHLVNMTNGVRPVISLIPGIEYVDGDGSMEHPYRVDDGTN